MTRCLWAAKRDMHAGPIMTYLRYILKPSMEQMRYKKNSKVVGLRRNKRARSGRVIDIRFCKRIRCSEDVNYQRASICGHRKGTV